MKLRSYLQNIHAISRRGIADLIDAGSIFLDKEKVVSYAHDVEEGQLLEIHYKHKPSIKENVHFSDEQQKVLLFNKPVGFVVSKDDPHNRTIYELLPPRYKDRWYIGRLDKESRGLVVLTNVSALVEQYEHPKYGIQKEYKVRIHKQITDADLTRLREGVQDEVDGKIESLPIHLIERSEDKQEIGIVLRVILTQGKKRHIRRAFSALKYHVVDLQRIHEGKYHLGDIQEGERLELPYTP